MNFSQLYEDSFKRVDSNQERYEDIYEGLAHYAYAEVLHAIFLKLRLRSDASMLWEESLVKLYLNTKGKYDIEYTKCDISVQSRHLETMRTAPPLAVRVGPHEITFR